MSALCATVFAPHAGALDSNVVRGAEDAIIVGRIKEMLLG